MTVINLSISENNKGELLHLVGTCEHKKLKEQYRKRWTIEEFFQALKERGLISKDHASEIWRNIEYAIETIAYSICWLAGIEDGRENPVKCKKHGYPQNSAFRQGLDILREEIKRKSMRNIQPNCKKNRTALCHSIS